MNLSQVCYNNLFGRQTVTGCINRRSLFGFKKTRVVNIYLTDVYDVVINSNDEISFYAHGKKYLITSYFENHAISREKSKDDLLTAFMLEGLLSAANSHKNIII